MNTPHPASDPPECDALLRVEALCTHIRTRRGLLRAVDDVSLSLPAGRTLGLVGESGCGKSTLSRTILRLIPATGGRVIFEGRDILRLPAGRMRRLRPRIQMIFQDPAGSLNPRLTVETIVGEALQVHRLVRSRAERSAAVAQVLERVGLSAGDARRHPHEFSGGQRQRIGIARALVLRPKLVICDEPVSALDVSVRAQVLNLLADLRDEFGLTYLFISHDLSVVRLFCDDLAVMYAGRIVEQAPAAELFADPRHPYTRMLMAAAPTLHDDGRDGDSARGGFAAVRALTVAGEPPDLANLPRGCAYAPRCPLAEEACRRETPPLTPYGQSAPAAEQASGSALGGRRVACWRAEESAALLGATVGK